MVCDAVSRPRRRLVLCPVLEVGDIESPLACRCWRNVSRNRSRPRERRRRGWCRWPHALIRGITRSAPANAASTSPGRRHRRRTDRARCLADQPAGPTSCLASSGRTFSRPAEASGCATNRRSRRFCPCAGETATCSRKPRQPRHVYEVRRTLPANRCASTTPLPVLTDWRQAPSLPAPGHRVGVRQSARVAGNRPKAPVAG